MWLGSVHDVHHEWPLIHRVHREVDGEEARRMRAALTILYTPDGVRARTAVGEKIKTRWSKALNFVRSEQELAIRRDFSNIDYLVGIMVHGDHAK